MRPISVIVGPLATATATKIATAQRNYGAGGALALNGAASNAVSTAVAASQAPATAALTLNGTTAVSGVAHPNGYIYITSSGNDSALTWAVVGVDKNGVTISETIYGTNAQSSASTKQYWKITSITPSGSVAANVTVGSFTVATLDVARRVLFTTVGNESANVATITGTNWAGDTITEALTLTNGSTNYTVLDYLTVTSITMKNAAAGNISVGTTTVASSPWVRFDEYISAPAGGQAVVTGTANYMVETTFDNPDSFSNPVAPSAVVWDSTMSPIVGAAATASFQMAAVPVFARVTLNSGSGSVKTKFVQYAALTS